MRSTGTHRHICLPCSTAPIHSALHHRTPALQSLKRIRKFKHTTTASGPKTADENFSFRPRKRSDWQIGPSFELSGEQAVLTQLEALQRNNDPSPDHGIEVLYRFANFDPFTRSNYFGVNRDLGQFERFRRIFHTPHYSILLSHVQHAPLSSLKVSELQWKQRMWVKGYKAGEEGIFEFNMVQRLGGRYDGVWFTDQLTCDNCPSSSLSV